MPKVFNYHKSHAHRAACLSLLRALFREATHFTRTTSDQGHSFPPTVLKSLIRFRFRRDRKPGQSVGAIADALNTGNEALRLLRNASDLSPTAISTLVAHLNNTSVEADLAAAWREEAKIRAQPAPKSSQYQQRHIREVSTKRLQAAPSRFDDPENKPKLDHHPLPLLSLPLRNGKRQRNIPHVISTSVGNTALLQYKGFRQPAWMRRVFRQQIKIQTRNFERSETSMQLIALSRAEDRWDVIVEAQARNEGVQISSDQTTRTGEPRWILAAADDRSEIFHHHQRSLIEQAVKGWYLFQIAKQEKWMAEKESLPYKIASALQRGQRLQEETLQYEDTPQAPHRDIILDPLALSHKRRPAKFKPRSKETSKALIKESLACAPLIIPTAWSEKVRDRKLPNYLLRPKTLGTIVSRVEMDDILKKVLGGRYEELVGQNGKW